MTKLVPMKVSVGSFTFSFDTVIVTGKNTTPISKALQDNLSSLGVAVGSGAPAAGAGRTVVLNVVTDQRERAVVGRYEALYRRVLEATD